MFWHKPIFFLQKFYSPNILAVASSLVGEDSLSHHVDPAIGVYIIDRYHFVKVKVQQKLTQLFSFTWFYSDHNINPDPLWRRMHRYTYYALEFLERVTPNSKKTMGEFLKVCPKRVCISTVGTRTDLFRYLYFFFKGWFNQSNSVLDLQERSQFGSDYRLLWFSEKGEQ